MPEQADAAREALARARAAARDAGSAPTTGPGRRRTARSSAAGRDPVTAGESLRDLLAEREWTAPARVAAVTARWTEVVGEQIAAHVVPETFDPGTGRLVLRADSTTWASALRPQLPTVAARLAQEVGPDVVRQLSVLGPTAPSWRHGPRSVPGRGPRDTYG